MVGLTTKFLILWQEKRGTCRNNLLRDEDRTSLIVRQNVKNAGTVAVVLTFNEDQTILDVDFYGVAHIDSPLKREELLKLVNELNCTYRFPKFAVTDGGNVVVQYPFLIDENCDFDHVFFIIGSVLDIIETDAMGKFMKLQWS